MSVIVTARYEGEPFEVEIFRDGGLDFPGRNLEYDQTIAALGGNPSDIVKFDDSWIENHQRKIRDNIDLPESIKILMLADFAEHVLHIFEDEYRNDKRPRAAVDAVRKFANGEIDKLALKRFEEDAWQASSDASNTNHPRTEKVAAWQSSTASWMYATIVEIAAWTAMAATSAAHSVVFDKSSIEWKQFLSDEAHWRIRRFVDVMEAIGQGLPWPPLEATQ